MFTGNEVKQMLRAAWKGFLFAGCHGFYAESSTDEIQRQKKNSNSNIILGKRLVCTFMKLGPHPHADKLKCVC